MKNFDRVLEVSKKYFLGFTIHPETLEKPKKGYGVSLLETQNCFGIEGLKKAYQVALERNCYIGGWRNPKNSKYYYDATVVVEDYDEAIRLAKENKQLAIYNYTTGETITIEE